MDADALFDQVGEVVRGSAPRELGPVHLYVHRNGVKAWYGDRAPANREHYEAQLIRADIATDAREYALEIGFHAEHTREPDNEATITRLRAHENAWRETLGKDAVAGAFLGRDSWRRVSETWLDPDLSDPDTPFEIGVRLVEYIATLEPLRRTP
ncbi:hypothetical protein [Spirillospora sp. CA-294931]|uniref:hypothetical protein n=1 Tax=Spirillospora sp. CA-294931 TaxID=3240042 RepID=UPI003D8EE674